MTDELRVEVVVPPRTRRRVLLLATSGAVLGAAIAVLVTVFWLPSRTRSVMIDDRRELEQVPVPEPSPDPVSIDAGMPEPFRDVSFVFSVGGDTYMELDAFEMPRHRKGRLVDDEATSAVAEVAPEDLPEDLRAWHKRNVLVDGECEARVTGFAVIGRLRGSPPDAGLDEGIEWTADLVLEHGAPRLAARLDGCTGTFARDASLPAITILAEGSDAALAERAREHFLLSPHVVETDEAWRDAGNEGTWYEAHDGRFETRVLRHPGTGAQWVLIHAYRFGDCGEIGGSVVGLYRVDATEKLVDVQVRPSGIVRIEHVVDLQGDGEPELVGSASIERAGGDSISAVGVALIGCGC